MLKPAVSPGGVELGHPRQRVLVLADVEPVALEVPGVRAGDVEGVLRLVVPVEVERVVARHHREARRGRRDRQRVVVVVGELGELRVGLDVGGVVAVRPAVAADEGEVHGDGAVAVDQRERPDREHLDRVPGGRHEAVAGDRLDDPGVHERVALEVLVAEGAAGRPAPRRERQLAGGRVLGQAARAQVLEPHPVGREIGVAAAHRVRRGQRELLAIVLAQQRQRVVEGDPLLVEPAARAGGVARAGRPVRVALLAAAAELGGEADPHVLEQRAAVGHRDVQEDDVRELGEVPLVALVADLESDGPVHLAVGDLAGAEVVERGDEVQLADREERVVVRAGGQRRPLEDVQAGGRPLAGLRAVRPLRAVHRAGRHPDELARLVRGDRPDQKPSADEVLVAAAGRVLERGVALVEVVAVEPVVRHRHPDGVAVGDLLVEPDRVRDHARQDAVDVGRRGRHRAVVHRRRHARARQQGHGQDQCPSQSRLRARGSRRMRTSLRAGHRLPPVPPPVLRTWSAVAGTPCRAWFQTS